MVTSRVVLVDDNLKFAAFLGEYLSEFGDLKVVGTAASAEEALQAIDRLNPDLLIVDLAMPGMNGLDLTQQVKARWPGILLIVLTLFDSPRHRQAAFDAGADAFIPKGRMDSDLLPAIWELLQQ